MQKLLRSIIKDKTIIDDIWTVVDTISDVSEVGDGNLLVTLAVWQQHKDALLNRPSGKVGLALANTDEPSIFAKDLDHIHCITVDFPTFTDGRGFSLARLLRTRYGYTGELRAVGDVLRDQLYYMHRCGFNAFAIREDKCIDDALNAYQDFSIGYQADALNSQPIYRRTATI